MIEIMVEQGSDEWKQLRAGIPTASNLSKIVTTSGKRSTQWVEYMNRLIAERILGRSIDDFQNEAMKRGIELEPQAALLYELHHDISLRSAGICFQDEQKKIGFSPDRFVIDADGITEGGLEIKCPSPAVHVGYHRKEKLPTAYKQQVWGSLYLSDLNYWDFMSYHPEIAPFYYRITCRDEDYLDFSTALESLLPTFIDELDGAYQLAIYNKLIEAA